MPVELHSPRAFGVHSLGSQLPGYVTLALEMGTMCNHESHGPGISAGAPRGPVIATFYINPALDPTNNFPSTGICHAMGMQHSLDTARKHCISQIPEERYTYLSQDSPRWGDIGTFQATRTR